MHSFRQYNLLYFLLITSKNIHYLLSQPWKLYNEVLVEVIAKAINRTFIFPVKITEFLVKFSPDSLDSSCSRAESISPFKFFLNRQFNERIFLKGLRGYGGHFFILYVVTSISRQCITYLKVHHRFFYKETFLPKLSK